MPAHTVSPTILQLISPVGASDFAEITKRTTTVQWTQPLTDPEFQQLADFLKTRPSITLRPYNPFGSGTHYLDFLTFFPTLRRLSLDCLPGADLSNLESLPDSLTHLRLGDYAVKQVTFDSFARFKHLKALSLEGKFENPSALANLKSLRALAIRGASVTDLRILTHLPRLRALDLSGGKIDLSPLATIPLQFLTLGRLTQHSDITILAHLHKLRFLNIYWQPQIQSFPNLKNLTALELVNLEKLLGLNDARGLAQAPSLRNITFANTPALSTPSRTALANHPKIAFCHIYPKGPSFGDNDKRFAHDRKLERLADHA